ncbi:Hypothetical protein Tpal_794 [Trichococcus palustris]|jgi:hypothetical protein|uniref:Uncharacterized protein n=1 Tax=Trichococcus palustris TaxID=140314 RepID=A0A143YBD1_9LACT|nr:hypothetical protein [Trichococcus palustris]CZQ86624.1 Hypothetical protein Tpal_794 [Trichococcus palustris]SFK80972.1 hypothetical protein SAMN04488076_105167 [Trichococcus palustris]
MLKMRERVSNRMAANETAEKIERKMHGNERLRSEAKNTRVPVMHQLNTTPNGSSKETDEKNRTTYGDNSVTQADKKYLFKRIAASPYSFVQT